jgi:phage gpG-like protein
VANITRKTDKWVYAEVNGDDALKALKQQVWEFRTRLKEQMFGALTLLEAAILQNIRSNSGLNVMSGKLLNSIGRSKKIREESQHMLVGEIGPKGVPYAAIHEFGGTIVPRNAQALTIPTPENLRRDGKPKITVQEAMESGDSFIRNDTIFLRMQKMGKGKKKDKVLGLDFKPIFLLRKSADIPARPYLAPAISATQDEILKNFGLFLVASFPKKEG